MSINEAAQETIEKIVSTADVLAAEDLDIIRVLRKCKAPIEGNRIMVATHKIYGKPKKQLSYFSR